MAVLGDILQVKFFVTAGDQLAINVRHYKVTLINGTGASDDQIAELLDTGASIRYPPCIAAGANYYGVSVQRIIPTLDPSIHTSNANQAAGTAPGFLMPRQVAGIVTLRTGAAGRRARGRAYIPFPGTTNQSGTGHPTNAHITAMQTLADTVFKGPVVVPGTGAGNNLQLTGIIYHRAATTGDPIVTCVARATWGTQKRRGDYGRPNQLPF